MKTYGSMCLYEPPPGSPKPRPVWVLDLLPHVRMRLKHVFGSISTGSVENVRITHTDQVCRDLEWFMMRYPLEMSEPDRKALKKASRREKKRGDDLAAIFEGTFEIPPVEMALPARGYQEQAAAALFKNKSLLVVDELGLGKTVTALRALADNRCLPAVCVLPRDLVLQWRDEAARFLPDARVKIIKNGKVKDLRDSTPNFPHIILTTYGLVRPWGEYLAHRVKTVVFDEVQELRTGHRGSLASKKNVACAELASRCEYRLGLTATPIYNYGGEIWNLLDVLSPGVLGSRPEFLREWCEGTDDKKAIVKDPEALGTALRDMGIMTRRTRDDVGIEIPALTDILHEVPDNEEFRLAFRRSTRPAFELARVVLDRSEKSFQRMQAGGMLDSLLRQATGIAKAPAVAAFVEMLLAQNTDKVVLFGWHREVYDIWATCLKKYGVAWYTGSESPTKKRAQVADFVKGDAKVLMMSLRSGKGLDGLQGACATAVHGELDWSPQVHEQCTGRLHRPGQKRPVFAYYMVANSGSDPVVSDVLGLKTAQNRGIRDPGGDVLLPRQADPHHIQKLAEAYLLSSDHPECIPDTQATPVNL